MTTTYLWTPPPVRSLPMKGKVERLPTHRIFCVGRNYRHEMELVLVVGKNRERRVPGSSALDVPIAVVAATCASRAPSN